MMTVAEFHNEAGEVTAVLMDLFNFKLTVFQILGHLHQFRALCLNLKCHARCALLLIRQTAVTVLYLKILTCGDAFSNHGGNV